MSTCLSLANQYGDLDVRDGVPKGYEHVRGERLQPICRKLKIRFAQALLGWGGTKRFPKPLHNGVVVSVRSAPRLRLALSEREQRATLRREREQAKEKLRVTEQLEKQRQAFRDKFPNAIDETVEKFFTNGSVYATLEEVPLGKLLPQEIEDLRLSISDEVGVLLTDGGATVVPLFSANLPEDDSPNTSDEETHRRAMELGFTPQKALWALNKFVKIVRFPPKQLVYPLKDNLIGYWSEYLIDGRIARHESKVCWSCNGSGIHWSDEECFDCGGSGYYSYQILYEVRYRFPGDERVYCFHTYKKPAHLTDEPGADQRSYGYRFSSEDRKQLLFGFHDLLRVVRHELKLLTDVAMDQARHHSDRAIQM